MNCSQRRSNAERSRMNHPKANDHPWILTWVFCKSSPQTLDLLIEASLQRNTYKAKGRKKTSADRHPYEKATLPTCSAMSKTHVLYFRHFSYPLFDAKVVTRRNFYQVKRRVRCWKWRGCKKKFSKVWYGQIEGAEDVCRIPTVRYTSFLQTWPGANISRLGSWNIVLRIRRITRPKKNKFAVLNEFTIQKTSYTMPMCASANQK